MHSWCRSPYQGWWLDASVVTAEDEVVIFSPRQLTGAAITSKPRHHRCRCRITATAPATAAIHSKGVSARQSDLDRPRAPTALDRQRSESRQPAFSDRHRLHLLGRATPLHTDQRSCLTTDIVGLLPPRALDRPHVARPTLRSPSPGESNCYIIAGGIWYTAHVGGGRSVAESAICRHHQLPRQTSVNVPLIRPAPPDLLVSAGGYQRSPPFRPRRTRVCGPDPRRLPDLNVDSAARTGSLLTEGRHPLTQPVPRFPYQRDTAIPLSHRQSFPYRGWIMEGLASACSSLAWQQ